MCASNNILPVLVIRFVLAKCSVFPCCAQSPVNTWSTWYDLRVDSVNFSAPLWWKDVCVERMTVAAFVKHTSDQILRTSILLWTVTLSLEEYYLTGCFLQVWSAVPSIAKRILISLYDIKCGKGLNERKLAGRSITSDSVTGTITTLPQELESCGCFCLADSIINVQEYTD